MSESNKKLKNSKLSEMQEEIDTLKLTLKSKDDKYYSRAGSVIDDGEDKGSQSHPCELIDIVEIIEIQIIKKRTFIYKCKDCNGIFKKKLSAFPKTIIQQIVK